MQTKRSILTFIPFYANLVLAMNATSPGEIRDSDFLILDEHHPAFGAEWRNATDSLGREFDDDHFETAEAMIGKYERYFGRQFGIV